MAQAPEVRTAEQLDERLRTVLKNNPGITKPGDWPAQFSLKPVTDGSIAVSISRDGGPPEKYSLWLQKGASGDYDQFVFLTKQQVQDIYKKEVIQGVFNPIAGEISPANPGFRTGPTGQMGWFKNDQRAEPPFAVKEVLVDPANKKIIPDAGAIKHLPAVWWVRESAGLKAGDEVKPENRFDPAKDGFKRQEIYIHALDDPAAAALDAQAKIFTRAVNGSVRAEAGGVVSEAAVAGSKMAVMRAPEPPKAAPAPAVPAARVADPEDAAPKPLSPPAESKPAPVAAAAAPPPMDLKAMEVLLPEKMPTGKSQAEMVTYHAASQVMWHFKEGNIPADKLDALIGQFREGDKKFPADQQYVPILEKLKTDPNVANTEELFNAGKARKESIGAEDSPGARRRAARMERQSAPVDDVVAKAKLEGPVAQDAATRAGKGTNYVTVDMGPGKGIGVLWQDGNGKYNVLTQEQVYDRLGDIMNAKKTLQPQLGGTDPARAWGLYMQKLTSPLDEVAKITGKEQKADFDFSKFKEQDFQSEAQRLGERLMKETEPANKPQAAISDPVVNLKPV